MLIHKCCRLHSLPPDLPIEFLSADLLRPRTAALFQKYYNLLSGKANRYFVLVFEEYDWIQLSAGKIGLAYFERIEFRVVKE